MWRLWISFAVAASLTACSSDPVSPGPRSSGLTPASFHTGGLPPPTQCVLFARDFTGVHLRGDAYAWWDAAAGVYPRSDTPHADTILVLRATTQLHLGHVGIVKKVVGPREILVTHANWGSDDPTRRVVHDSTAVVDVSPGNDWSQLRFWNAPSHAFGKVYAAYGFIYPKRFDANDQAVW
jgi:hypothetical protein